MASSVEDAAAHRRPIQVKLTEAERALVDEAADGIGLPTSTWMRFVVIKQAQALKRLWAERPEALPRKTRKRS